MHLTEINKYLVHCTHRAAGAFLSNGQNLFASVANRIESNCVVTLYIITRYKTL